MIYSEVTDALQRVCAAVLLCVASMQAAGAGEIHYASIKDIRGDSILTLYKGPGGFEYFICNSRSERCESSGTQKPYLFPLILNSRDYVRSTDGRYALVENPVTTNRNKSSSYALYSLNQPEPELITRLPFNEPASRIIFSPDNNVIVLLMAGGKIATYTIDSSAIALATLTQTRFPFRSLSYRGSYLAAYNQADAVHMIWDTKTGEKVAIPGTLPGSVEFSADESHAAFIENINGFPGLRVVDLKAFPHNISVESLPLHGATVVGCLFIGDNLYYMSNEASPYEWSIYEYDIRKKTKKMIATEVSYSGGLRHIGGRLAYPRIEGKNTNIALYDPLDKATSVLRPYPDSPVSPSILKEKISLGDYNGVLVYPGKTTRDARPLFVWLHGGPMRQTSVTYHPYLSYAVYDELLDRIALAGSYVLKLDYPGSYGYGYDFANSLNNNIGIIDVNSVVVAVEQLRKERNIGDIYLIGNSYGGYLSLRTLVEAPDLFAGAISINGVYDWFTLIKHINSSPFKDLFDGTPDLEDHDRNVGQYLAAGIYSRVPNIDGHKILLILGENDATVPAWQTKEFFHVLNALNKSVELVKFADEDHILRKRANLDKLCTKVLSLSSQSADVCTNDEFERASKVK